MLNRRHVLAMGAIGSSLALARVSAVEAAEAAEARGATAGGRAGTRAAPAPFSVPMPVPPVLRPTRTTGDTDHYALDITPGTAEILPGVSTPVLTYGGSFTGPVIRATRDRRTVVRYTNRLAMPANVHLHGGHVPPQSDGHPMDLIAPGAGRSYEYPNRQRGATLWFHDHSHHMEAEHVYRGLHGFYLLSDPQERKLDLPTGAYDVPILLRDAQLDAAGAFVIGDPAQRDIIMANGRPQPYFPVAARKYRLRLLNGATERIFRLSLDGAAMVQIASDGGLLAAPVARTEILLGPAERVEIVVDFGRHPVGSRLVLSDASAGPVLRFDVTRAAADTSRVPPQFAPLPPMPPATTERDITMRFDLTGAAPVGVMNERPFDPDRVDVRIPYGATEVWRVTNTDVGSIYGPLDHSFHLHLVQFRVLDRDGGPPWPGDQGLKDTIYVPPGTTARVQATFTGYTGRYVYHCHMLEHSSVGMMAQFEIVR